MNFSYIINHRGQTRIHWECANFDKYDLVICDSIFLDKFGDSCYYVDVSSDTKEFGGEQFNNLLEEVHAKNPRRVLVVGGGTIQDLSSFVCSIYHRGIEWDFMPTTLASMVDSCIGSKTSLDYKNTKNKLGTFFPAINVYINIEFLDTLSDEQWYDGLGELQHIMLLPVQPRGVNSDFSPIYLDEVKNEPVDFIKKSLWVKKQYVQIDEFDKNTRKYLNLGHTFAHALEKQETITHGLAVSWGLLEAIELSAHLGLLSENIKLRLVDRVYHQYIPKLSSLDIEKYIDSLSKDKKAGTDAVRFILLNEVENGYCPQIVPVKYETITNFLKSKYA